jgi:thymidylate kinase
MASVRKDFFVLEGVDAAGKSSVGKLLAERIGSAYVKTPGEQYKAIRAHIDNGTPKETKFFFYLATVMDASAEIGRALETQPVVCDRYIWSTLIPHSAYHGDDLGELERVWQPFSNRIAQPTNTILLTVSEDEQSARMMADRDMANLSASDRHSMNPEKRRRVKDLYETIAKRDGWLVVDTTGRNADEVAQEIIDYQGRLSR